MAADGKGACILPHGVLFRGNAEGEIRKNIVKAGYIKGLIGLPQNLFYGTGIPACIIILDKQEASDRKGIFMIDAKDGFVKDGNMNRLREEDIQRIVDTWEAWVDVPHYARFVPQEEIEKNDYNLNIPRYVDTFEAEDVIDLDAITRIQLNQLQGQLLRVVIDHPQLSVDVFFDENKVRLEPTVTGHSQTPSIFEQRPYDVQNKITDATATLHVANVVELVKLLLSDMDQIGNIPLQGDYHLLQDIQRIIQQAEPDLAAHLSPWIGPQLAHELSKIQLAPKQLKRSLQSHLFFVEDALKEDSGLFAPRWQMDDLNRETRQLNQEVDRLEARFQQLQAQFNSHQQSTQN